MKKLFVILFSFLYLVLASGFTQYSHACKGMAMKTFSLTNTAQQNSDEPCPICADNEKGLTQKKKGCCQHEAKIVKVEDSVKKQSQFDFSVKFWGDAIPNKTLGTVFDFPLITDNTKQTPSYFSSKVAVRGTPLYIYHCVYRI
jgi:hypothetical protein